MKTALIIFVILGLLDCRHHFGPEQVLAANSAVPPSQAASPKVAPTTPAAPPGGAPTAASDAAKAASPTKVPAAPPLPTKPLPQVKVLTPTQECVKCIQQKN